jgi:hypothetical protein
LEDSPTFTIDSTHKIAFFFFKLIGLRETPRLKEFLFAAMQRNNSSNCATKITIQRGKKRQALLVTQKKQIKTEQFNA